MDNFVATELGQDLAHKYVLNLYQYLSLKFNFNLDPFIWVMVIYLIFSKKVIDLNQDLN